MTVVVSLLLLLLLLLVVPSCGGLAEGGGGLADGGGGGASDGGGSVFAIFGFFANFSHIFSEQIDLSKTLIFCSFDHLRKRLQYV
jgi:hypothetical protein